jgi:hypothetical protein
MDVVAYDSRRSARSWRERASFFLPEPIIVRAFARAGERGRFDLDAASPVIAAQSIRLPILLIHGEADTETNPDHSRRVLAALAGPKRLVLLPGAGHNHSLGSERAWMEIENWIEGALEVIWSEVTEMTDTEGTEDTDRALKHGGTEKRRTRKSGRLTFTLQRHWLVRLIAATSNKQRVLPPCLPNSVCISLERVAPRKETAVCRDLQEPFTTSRSPRRMKSQGAGRFLQEARRPGGQEVTRYGNGQVF